MLIIVRCLWVEAKRANQLIEIIKTSQHMRNINLVLLSVSYEHVEIIRSATQSNPCHAFHKLKISLHCVHSLCMHAVNAQCFRYWRRKIREGNKSVIHPRNCAFSQQRAPNFQWCSLLPPHTHSRGPGSRRFFYPSIYLFSRALILRSSSALFCRCRRRRTSRPATCWMERKFLRVIIMRCLAVAEHKSGASKYSRRSTM